MNILHLAANEPKFIDSGSLLFESVSPGRNRWRVLGMPADRNRGPMTAVTSDYFSWNGMKDDLRWADLLVCHSMHPTFVPAVRSAPDSLTVVWRMWGYEYRHLIEHEFGGQYLPQTAALRRRLHGPGGLATRPSRDLLRRLCRRARRLVVRSAGSISDIAGRIDVVVGYRSDMDALERALPNLDAQRSWFSYRTMIPRPQHESRIDAAHGIQIGNSATYSNNHLEAFDAIGASGLGEREIVVPLSYGDRVYADHLERIGVDRFDGRFHGLRRFLPLEEYNRLLASVGYFLLNCRCQQAMGNVFAALLSGKKVFLRPENSMLHELREDGLVVNSTEEVELHGAEALEPLSREEREHNRALVADRFHPDKVHGEIEALRDELGVSRRCA